MCFIERSVALSFASLLMASGLSGESLPDMRPALAGSDPTSLVNLIDTQSLIRKGQGHGAIFFRCFVEPSGQSHYRLAYGGTANTDVLREEVRQKLYAARFYPAVYHHQKTWAWFYGTVTFSVIDGKPHLRVYATQEKSEMMEGKDFISPQSVYAPGHRYDQTHRRKEAFGPWMSEDVPGIIELEMTVDRTGEMKSVHVVQETPPGRKYGEYALEQMKNFTWMPAFRNGRPTDSTTHLTYVFIPADFKWRK
jgi:hypothetical protein